jgi:NADH-quinone oxidoreductase subunit A
MTTLAGYMVLFTLIAVAFIFVHLMAGRFLRPVSSAKEAGPQSGLVKRVAGRFLRPVRVDPDKLTIYECGEPTIGSAWVQFDLRFYVVALLFVIFDVEVAFFFPWAVVFGHANTIAKADAAQDPARVALAKKELLGPQQAITAENRRAAGQFAWLALIDIAVFFGVLLVGFAYLWRRGDLDWVRSTAAERGPPPDEMDLPVLEEADQLVGANPT